MTNDWNGVVAWAKANPTNHGLDWDGRCESLVQNAGAYGTGFLTAHAAFVASHVLTPAQLAIEDVPTGWNLWWDYVAGDGTNYGHVAFAAPGKLALMATGVKLASTIHTHLGYVDRATYAKISGHRYLGASRDHGGKALAGAAALPAANPAAPAAKYVTAVKDDSLSRIAAAHKITLARIEALNPQIKGPKFVLPIGAKVWVA